ncbi:MAG TPA: MAPEG family protein [Burkholderiaceae bacterium]|nr:MAPEG family protein [Burkholderiaceae bacterium]HQR71701.1 MAPEG family protein [Burkholderiaceae bacterium]
MTIAFWCVLAAALLPYLGTLVAKASGERYNNRDPRAWLDRQTGMSRRADNAQKNGFEAFPFFAAAVIVAYLTHAPPERVDILALIFIAARLVYFVCYLADWQAMRSLVWMMGFVACLTIFLLGV